MSKRISLAPPPIPLEDGWGAICLRSNLLLAGIGAHFVLLKPLLENAGSDMASGKFDLKTEAKASPGIVNQQSSTLQSPSQSGSGAQKEEKKEIIDTHQSRDGIAVVSDKNGDPAVSISAKEMAELHQ